MRTAFKAFGNVQSRKIDCDFSTKENRNEHQDVCKVYTELTKGQQLKIYDGMYSETVTVASTYVFGSTTVPLETPLF